MIQVYTYKARESERERGTDTYQALDAHRTHTYSLALSLSLSPSLSLPPYLPPLPPLSLSLFLSFFLPTHDSCFGPLRATAPRRTVRVDPSECNEVCLHRPRYPPLVELNRPTEKNKGSGKQKFKIPRKSVHGATTHDRRRP